MLRIDFQETAKTLTMRMEGRFVAHFAEEARAALQARCKVAQRLVVDMSEVIFVDAIGEEVLKWLGRIGGQFVAENCYPRDVCERLHLPIVRKPVGYFPQAM
jgi:anti-anti-sigma regulatory factor